VIDDEGRSGETLSLAPMAVIPDFQKKGVGGLLIRHALDQALHLGFESVVVIGHTEYYSRFGFVKASGYNLKEPYGAPDEAFMAIELKPGALREVSGNVIFPEEYNEGV
jgi:putative acetyltransferase